MNGELNIATWRTQWATLRTDRGRRFRSKLGDTDSDVISVGAIGVHDYLDDFTIRTISGPSDRVIERQH